MKIRFCLKGVVAIVLASVVYSLAFAESVEARSSAPRIQSGAPPKLVNAAVRRNEIFDIVSEHGVVAEEFEIYAPGASFIKLHFSKFRLPAGIVVEISNPEGSEVYRYSRTKKDAKTFNPRQGDDGVHSFSAMSISGDTAVVRVEGNLGQIQAFRHTVEIDYFMEGLPEYLIDDSPSVAESVSFIERSGKGGKSHPESRCGSDDRENVACLESTYPTEADRSRPVVRLLIDGSTLCTAWRIGSNNHLMTNRHCLPDQAKTSSTEVWFGFQYAECGSYVISADQIKVTGNLMLKNNVDLDYTLFTINQFEDITGFGYLGIETREGVIGEEIYIPQHGSGNPKEIGIESDMNVGGYCQVDDVNLNAYAAGTDVGYFCDTTGGSSGSPVLAADSHRAIALHHLGGCLNQGVSMSLIWPEIAEFFGGVVPSGDDADPVDNQPPLSQFGVSCSGLHCEFDASPSVDVDGSIVSYDWSLGDGSTSAGMNVSHDFAGDGAFEVALAVQDNDGAIGHSTDTVTVTDANAAPVAVFTVECDQGNCSFDASASYDSDGTISTYTWDFGDSSGVETADALFSHEYAAAGDYLVQLTVTDDLAATGFAESWISVSVAADPFELSATSQKRRGSKSVQLTWSGALTTQVDIFRNGSFLTTTGNDGEYTDGSLPKRSKSATYQVCQAGEAVCSNEINVKF